MELTKRQEQGLRIAVERYNEGAPYTCISGFAGSGKSTLISFIISALEVDPEEDVAYVAYTGKAANVLREKGCPNAVTAHKLIYYSKLMPNGKYSYTVRKTLEQPYKIIVVDEISMLPKSMWEQLLRYGIYILACGDPFQIPPINSKEDNHVLDNPHVFLDEIMRQAQESDIIRLSMDIRAMKPIKPFEGNDVKVFDKDALSVGMCQWADQILVGTNARRNQINDLMRKQLGFGEEPQIGDKIICLHNEWEIYASDECTPLTNGTIGYITDFSQHILDIPKTIYKDTYIGMLTNFKLDNGYNFENIEIDYKSISTGIKTLSGPQEYKLIKAYQKNIYQDRLPIEFNYGYAITVHRAQGSQWNNVLVVEERFPFDKVEHARWLYTAVTRSASKLVLVQN